MKFFRLSILPREEKFFILFEQSARNAVKIALQLKDMIHFWENVKERVGIISNLEHEGDAITHQIMGLLNTVFITPFDREDIVALAYALDDITDLIHSTAEIMLIYNVEQPVEKVRKLANVTVKAVMEIEKAISEIHNRIEREKITKRCVEINNLENTGDSIFRSLLSEFFSDTNDYVTIIKLREIYGNMEAVLDKCEDVANILEGISIRYA